jgi:hypothetical protein
LWSFIGARVTPLADKGTSLFFDTFNGRAELPRISVSLGSGTAPEISCFPYHPFDEIDA